MQQYVKVFFPLLLFTLLFNSVAEANCISVIPAGWHGSYWKILSQGAMQAGIDYQKDIQIRAPANDSEIDAQIKILESHKAKGCDGFVIAPISDVLNPFIAALKKKGISTVYVDRGVNSPTEAVSTVMTDNYQGGWVAGQELANQLNFEGDVAVLRFIEGLQSTTLREEGFLGAVKKAGLNVVLDEYMGVTKGEVFRKTIIIAPQLMKLDGFFTSNQTTTEGVILSLRESHPHRTIVHIGFDDSEIIQGAIKTGELRMTLALQPYEMGYKAVEILLEIMDGNSVSSRIYTPVEILSN